MTINTLINQVKVLRSTLYIFQMFFSANLVEEIKPDKSKEHKIPKLTTKAFTKSSTAYVDVGTSLDLYVRVRLGLVGLG